MGEFPVFCLTCLKKRVSEVRKEMGVWRDGYNLITVFYDLTPRAGFEGDVFIV